MLQLTNDDSWMEREKEERKNMKKGMNTKMVMFAVAAMVSLGSMSVEASVGERREKNRMSERREKESMEATVEEGICGQNAEWSYNAGGILTIRGTGNTEHYDNGNPPWKKFAAGIRRVIVEQGITSIGRYAFFECQNLETVELPEGLKSVGDSAFENCGALRSVVIPDTVTEIRDFAFVFCNSLESIKLPKNLTVLGYCAFQNCTSLEKIAIPSGVTRIEAATFEGCTALKEAILSERIEFIGDGAFMGCTNLESIVLPERLEEVRRNTFLGCMKLGEITIPKTVRNIGEEAFYHCTNLRKVTISGVLTKIEESAFKNSNPGLTIYGVEKSPAYEYAKTHQLQFVSIHEIHDYEEKITKATPKKDGKIEKRCKICNMISESKVISHPKKMKLSSTVYEYDGSEKRPSVKVICEDGTVLDSAHYEVKFDTEGREIGTHGVTILFRGEQYAGDMTNYFRIKPKTQKIEKGMSEKVGEIFVQYIKDWNATGYEVRYALNSNFSDGKNVRVTNQQQTSHRISNLSPGKFYYVKVRSYKTIGNQTYYGSYSLAKKIRIKAGTGVEIPVSSILISGNKVVAPTGKFSLKASVKPSNAMDKTLIWSSSKKKVATVSSLGVVTAKGVGVSNITARAVDGSGKSKTVKIIVRPKKLGTPILKNTAKGTVKVSWTKQKNVSGYEIEYSMDSSFRNAKIKKVSYIYGGKSVTGLSRGTYYMRVRAYKTLQSGTYNGTWSNTVKIVQKFS